MFTSAIANPHQFRARRRNSARIVPLFRCASRPGDRNQKSTLLHRLDIVMYAMVEGHQFSGGKFDLLTWQMNTNLTLQRMDRDSGIGMVLLHLRVGPHENQDNPEVWILGE